MAHNGEETIIDAGELNRRLAEAYELLEEAHELKELKRSMDIRGDKMKYGS